MAYDRADVLKFLDRNRTPRIEEPADQVEGKSFEEIKEWIIETLTVTRQQVASLFSGHNNRRRQHDGSQFNWNAGTWHGKIINPNTVEIERHNDGATRPALRVIKFRVDRRERSGGKKPALRMKRIYPDDSPDDEMTETAE